MLRIIMLVGLIVVCASVVFSEEPTPKVGAFESLKLVKVIKVEDLDRITVQLSDREYVVSLSCVLPFSQWPKTRERESAGFKRDTIELLKTRLVGKSDVFIQERPVSAASSVTPVVTIVVRSPADWTEGLPSSRAGWFMTDMSILLIERGLSPHVHQASTSARPQTPARGDLCGDAETLAMKNRSGIWRENALAQELRAVAERKSDPPAIVLADLTEDALLNAIDALIQAEDQRVRSSAAYGLAKVISSRSAEKRGPLTAGLLKACQQEKVPAVLASMIDAIRVAGDNSDPVKVFLGRLAKEAMDETVKKAATTSFRSLFGSSEPLPDTP